MINSVQQFWGLTANQFSFHRRTMGKTETELFVMPVWQCDG